MKPTATLPTASGQVGDFARHLATLLGPAYNAQDGTAANADVRGLAQGLSDGRDTTVASLDEAFPYSADQILGEWEAAYGLPSRADLTTAERQTRLLAKVRAARAATPESILAALGVIESAADLGEQTYQKAVDDGYPPGVFRFWILMSVGGWNNTDERAAVTALVEQMKPAHARFYVGTQRGFYCDDPNSLVDRDLI